MPAISFSASVILPALLNRKKTQTIRPWPKRMSVGDAVKRYIMEQQGKDVFEYSIFGDSTGQTKMGDFSG